MTITETDLRAMTPEHKKKRCTNCASADTEQVGPVFWKCHACERTFIPDDTEAEQTT